MDRRKRRLRKRFGGVKPRRVKPQPVCPVHQCVMRCGSSTKRVRYFYCPCDGCEQSAKQSREEEPDRRRLPRRGDTVTINGRDRLVVKAIRGDLAEVTCVRSFRPRMRKRNSARVASGRGWFAPLALETGETDTVSVDTMKVCDPLPSS